jgi:hypothetical protein
MENNGKSSKKKKIVTGLAIAGAVLAASAALAGGIAIAKKVQAAGFGQQAKDEHSLIVGTEASHDGLPVSLTLSIADASIAANGGVLFTSTLSSDSPQMAARAGQDASLVFHDFTDEVKAFVSEAGIFYWETGAEGWAGHFAYASTACGSTASSKYNLGDSGIWYLSTADSNGAAPAYVGHSEIYETDSLTW